ncbi:MAG TPA: hypothetical protein VNP96_02230 [Solirubrobacterales bacterium]|nr:hypothetical protein [Solirubrobacterales bacterium]
MCELVDALEAESTIAGDESEAASQADQIASLVLAEAVRLIRLGTRSETTGAGAELANALIGPRVPELEDRHADAFLSLVGASRVLRAASAPSSPGADLTVLRSWNGKALEVVEALIEAPDEALPRAEIRALLGEVDESYLSHLLADLEAARLIVRIREGRVVTVHLGIVGRSERVRRMLPEEVPAPSWSHPQGQMVPLQSFSIEEEFSFTPLHAGFDHSRQQEADLGRDWHEHEFMLKTLDTLKLADKKWIGAYEKETPTLHKASPHSSGE